MFYKRIFSLSYCTILNVLLTSQIVFSVENNESPMKLQKKLKNVHEIVVFFVANPKFNSMTTASPGNVFFDFQNTCYWILYPPNKNLALQKHFLLLQTYEEYPRSIEEHANWLDEDKRSSDNLKRTSLPHFNSIHCSGLVISPDEKYMIFRNSLESHILSEVKTGHVLTDKIPAGEIALGFDSQSNIYCGRLMSPPGFVVRDPDTMEIVKSFQRTIGGDITERDTSEQDLFYAICPLPVESPDRKYVIFQFYRHRPPGVTAKMHGNDPRLLKEWMELENDDPQECSIGVIHVYDQENGLLVYESPFGIGGRNLWANLLPMMSADGQKVAYPDHVGKGVWVYDFETRKSISLLVPPPTMPKTRSVSEKEAALQCWKETWSLRGFTFTPENQVLVWLYNRGNRAGVRFPVIYQFDPENGVPQVMTDFLSDTEFIVDDNEYDHTRIKSTWYFFYSSDRRTVITFQVMLGWPPEFLPHGKYVFWDYRTKKKLYETEARYRPNIILTPDWKTAILTTVGRDFDPDDVWRSKSDHGIPEIEFYDITGITERED